jgi:adenylate kinase family enzyme
MERIVILGSSGAGKSTFAKELGNILELEVFHLDRFFWSNERPEKTGGIEKLRDVTQRSRWLIDGNYFSLCELHLKEADTIVFLDISPWLCFWGVLQRYYKYYKRSPGDIPEGYTNKLILLRLFKILTFPLHGRRRIKRKLREYNSKQIVWLRSRKEVKAFLARFRGSIGHTASFSEAVP